MWAKRRKKNRRFEREHLLDVKVESRRLRTLRVRLAARIFSRVFGVATVSFLLWRGGDWALDEFVFKNPAFAVQEIDIETDGILPKAQLRACAGVRLGDNLLSLDLARIQRDLESVPWIQSAAVERVRPHTVKIRVTEREPIAQTVLFEPGVVEGKARQVTFYFDGQGQVMLPLNSLRVDPASVGFEGLPMLTGVSGVDLRPGHPAESAQIRAALQLIQAFGRSQMLGLADLTSVDLSVPQLLQVATTQGATIVFGAHNIELQLRRWRLVHDYAAQRGKAVASLDLSVSNNVPARWLEATVVPPIQPKLIKPSPYRKRHV